jgi:hypothetical protein
MSRFARKRDDSVKAGMGIDGQKGERFTKENVSSTWNPPNPGDKISKPGGAYTSNDRLLRNKQPDDVSNTPARDIFENVQKNSLDDKGTGPVKFGVD